MRRTWLLRTRRDRRFAVIAAAVLLWLALVCLLPSKPSNVAAAVGMVAAVIAYFRWAGQHPAEYPRWGCFINIPVTPMKIKMSDEGEAMILTHWERQTLLRAAQPESPPEQELLRPAAEVEDCPPEEMLRSSDNPD